MPAPTPARTPASTPASTIEQLLASKEIVIACGSGGVGKTTTAAAAAAMAAVRQGGRVLVLTVDPARRLANALGLEGFGNVETQVPPEAFAIAGVAPRGELWAAMLDTKQSWDDLVRRHAPDPLTVERILANPMYQNISGRFVQSHDYIAMERLYEIHRGGRYDLVVVDTPPTRNAIDFIEAPARMADFFSSRFLRLLIAPYRSRMVSLASRPFYSVADRVLGSQLLSDLAEFFILLQSMYDGFVERANAVTRLLHDKRTSFVVISTLEPAPVREAEFFIDELSRRRLHLGALVLNKVLPGYLLDESAVATAETLVASAPAHPGPQPPGLPPGVAAAPPQGAGDQRAKGRSPQRAIRCRHLASGVVATLAELARLHTRLGDLDIDHLKRLVASWGMLADLCFADLLLFVPVTGGEGSRFVVLGQVRPFTSQTLHQEDLVGRIVDEVERPLVARAWRLGQIVEGEITVSSRGERARTQCIPVRWRGRLLAVLARESAPSVTRRPGELERVYVEVFDRLARMLVDGTFPFSTDETMTEESPRVGDGVVVLDAGQRVEYPSPNAVNALHRMGISSNTEGMRLGELGLPETAVRTAFATSSPVTEELERVPDVIVLMQCIPLLAAGEVTGAALLMRDISELRRRDRLLMSKDATIREVHHRVKNNLQTISSLLRLQARRLSTPDGRQALIESERRVRSIALVHEILSRDTRDEVAFNEIVRPLVRTAEESVIPSSRPVRFEVVGDGGELPAQVATPLAVVLNELLQNAVEHGFPVGEEAVGSGEGVDGGELIGADDVPETGQVVVQLDNDGRRLSVQVRDNGGGLPDDFDIDRTSSLGLSIARTLVRSQLGGTIQMQTERGAGRGTCVQLVVPLAV